GEHDDRLEPATPARGRAAGAELCLPARDEARVVLVHGELPVEPQGLRVGAQEALDVRLRPEQARLVLPQRAEVLASDLRRLLGLGDLDPAALACLAEAAADLEHGPAV